MNSASVAKFLMKLYPAKPEYQEDFFMSEIFRHPKFTSLSPAEKEAVYENLVNNNIKEEHRKPFDLFYPAHSLQQEFKGKRLLDMGCGIGGTTIAMGERWHPAEFYGIDVNESSIDTANFYLSRHPMPIPYKFVQGYAENMPFEDDFFDAIVSHDTLEHVRSLKETLSECKRILKKGGKAFLVFPSMKLPFNGAHIGSATKTPFLEWFFSPTTINKAYQEIVKEWGDDLNWFKPTEETKGDWAVVKGGIGVNGTLYKDFMQDAEAVGFKNIAYVKIPLMYVSSKALQYPFLKTVSGVLKPLLTFDTAKDYLSHRLVFILQK